LLHGQIHYQSFIKKRLPIASSGVRIDYRRDEMAQIRAFHERPTDAEQLIALLFIFCLFYFSMDIF
jgi:hypothetical protein